MINFQSKPQLEITFNVEIEPKILSEFKYLVESKSNPDHEHETFCRNS